MIETISLCSTCYKKIPAFIYPKEGQVWMDKECDVHGKSTSLVEKSWQHVSNFYRYGTMGNNNAIIIHVHDKCNMKCEWCYYPGDEKIHDINFFNQLLYEPYKGFSLMLSGGEPTERPDYFEFVDTAYRMGWAPSTITNMINLADDGFFKKTLNDRFIDSVGNYRFALSYQHPKNYSARIRKKKDLALENIEKAGVMASCLVFSIQSIDELDFIKDFYDKTRHLYYMLRIRTMFDNWGNKGTKKMFLSELHAAFLDKFSEYTPVQSNKVEQSNMYCLYMETKEMRCISLSSAPTVDNIDCHLIKRPVYMLADDERIYPVPWAMIVNEEIKNCWHDGFKIGGSLCGSQ